MERTMKNLIWKKSPVKLGESFTPAVGNALPRRVDLRQWCSPIEDQGQLGSCTANAIVSMLEWLENKNHETSFARLSRLFVYFNERNMEGTITSDAGAFLHDGISSLSQYGICDETVWPYNESMFACRPNDDAYKAASTRRYHTYNRIDGQAAMLACLAEGYPFVFGAQVSESSFCVDVPGGIVPMITGYEKDLGGHAMCCVGYDLDKQYFIVRNSWGPSWGDNGYCYFPINYLGNQDFADDFWTVRGTFSTN
jgi:C1A family cysteine protease